MINSVNHLPKDYLDALTEAASREETPIGRACLKILSENATYASLENIPTCQDTGMVVIDIAIGQEVHLVGGDINQALNSAVRHAYTNLRKSVVNDPIERKNTMDNTPAVVHYTIVPGDRITINVLLKGFGAELMSAMRMFPPSAGVEGVKQFVIETVEQAGPNVCPPLIVGVGLGGSFDSVAYLAKKALMRPIGCPNPQSHLAALERELLGRINMLGIGPQGFGGCYTALAVHVESYPTHIAALPVAVNLNCSAPRRASLVI